MALHDELEEYCLDTFSKEWQTRDGQKIPKSKDVKLSNEAVHFDRATFLYADLSGSTNMVRSMKWWFSSEVYKTFLYGAARVIRDSGGTITSYDGDRIMAVWIGSNQSNDAARAALKINYFTKKVLQAKLEKHYQDRTNFKVKHSVGVDTSECWVSRTGIRGSNDLVWVGKAPNYAAKLSDHSDTKATWITARVYNYLKGKQLEGGNPKQNMWKSDSWSEEGGATIYSSNWTWKI